MELSHDGDFNGKQYHQTYQDGKTTTNVLNHLDISINSGERIAPLLALSRSGKSTLLHILGGLDVPTSGKFGYMGNASMI